jgi:hypothetical protein
VACIQWYLHNTHHHHSQLWCTGIPTGDYPYSCSLPELHNTKLHPHQTILLHSTPPALPAWNGQCMMLGHVHYFSTTLKMLLGLNLRLMVQLQKLVNHLCPNTRIPLTLPWPLLNLIFATPPLLMAVISPLIFPTCAPSHPKKSPDL